MAAPTTLRPTTSLASRNDVSPIPNIQSQANQNETMPISREQSTEASIFESTRNNDGSFATTSVTSDSSFEDIGEKKRLVKLPDEHETIENVDNVAKKTWQECPLQI